jgi:hypothetical protein
VPSVLDEAGNAVLDESGSPVLDESDAVVPVTALSGTGSLSAAPTITHGASFPSSSMILFIASGAC